MHLKQTKAVEQGVDGTQRTGRTAERTFRHDEQDEESGQDSDFQTIKPSHHTRLNDRFSERRIDGIPDYPGDTRDDGAPRTDTGEPVGPGEGGKQDSQDDQGDVLEFCQRFGDMEFFRPDPIHFILNPSERAEPAAGGPAHGNADNAEKSHQEQREFTDGREMLEYADGA